MTVQRNLMSVCFPLCGSFRNAGFCVPSLTRFSGMTPWWNDFDPHCPDCSLDAVPNDSFGGESSLVLLENRMSKPNSCDWIDL